MSFDLIDLLALDETRLLELALDCVFPVSRHPVCLHLLTHMHVAASRQLVLDRIFAIMPLAEIPQWAPLLEVLFKNACNEEAIMQIVPSLSDANALLCICEAANSEAVARRIFDHPAVTAEHPPLVYACLQRIPNDRNSLVASKWVNFSEATDINALLFLTCYLAPLLDANQWLLSEDQLFECLVSSERASRRNAKILLERKYPDWLNYWQIFDSVDEYASNLFKSIFVRLGDDSGPSDRHWWVLLRRCLTHENPFVIKHAVSMIVDGEKIRQKVNFFLPNVVCEFCKLVETGWVAGFNSTPICNGLAELIGHSLVNEIIFSKFLKYTIYEAKTYFPVVFCYWKAISLSPVKLPDSCLGDLDFFLNSKILAFSALVRPSLRRLLVAVAPATCPVEVPFVDEFVVSESELIESLAQASNGREVVALNRKVTQSDLDSSDFLLQYLEIASGLISNRNRHNIGPEAIDSMLRIALATVSEDSRVIAERMRFVSKLMDIGLKSNPLIGRHGVEFFLLNLKNVVAFGESAQVAVFLADLILYKEGLNAVAEVEDAAMEEEESRKEFSRILTIEAILALSDSVLCESVIACLLNRIVELQKTVPIAGPLPFSQIHRTQLRVAQGVICLILKTSQKFRRNVICPTLFGSILQWTNQPDVRDYFEILAIYLCESEKLILVDFVFPVLKKFALSSQSTASFVVVASFFGPSQDIVETLVPYLTSNVSYIRGIVQKWFFQHAAAIDCSVASQIAFITENKESVAMRRRLTCVYDDFDPVALVKSGDILARGISKHAELVPSQIFMTAIREGVHASLVSNWHYTRQQPEPIEEANKTACSLAYGLSDSQRKYRPQQLGSIFQSPREHERRNKSQLIVVTSLLDKTTNIAGLCRSAEVFGASTLVIASRNILKDAIFQKMAVTAEHWIDIVQVCPEGLEEYVASKKRADYTIVCLEQTHNSVELEKYKFDPKTVLILGNEKSGINLEHMHLMDVCVEIPQRGIIRSLNVHVSGAIAMYHYNISSNQ